MIICNENCKGKGFVREGWRFVLLRCSESSPFPPPSEPPFQMTGLPRSSGKQERGIKGQRNMTAARRERGRESERSDRSHSVIKHSSSETKILQAREAHLEGRDILLRLRLLR